MSMENNLNNFIQELVQEIEKELEEATVSANVAGYNTPKAFSDKGKKDKKRKKKIATSLGYSVVGNDVGNIDEARLNVRDLPSYVLEDPDDFEEWYDEGMEIKGKKKLAPMSKSDERKLFNLVEMWIESRDDRRYGSGSREDTDDIIKSIAKFLKQKGKVVKESVNEAKVKRPVNRWLELKNDETMHPHKKMAMGLKELKYQLRETEKFFNWYNKIKTMNELDSNQYWKRTNTHIYKIKERLVNIAKTIQEIEK